VAVVSYDEKPGIQAIATTAPDLSPEPGVYATFARDHAYKRQGTLSRPWVDEWVIHQNYRDRPSDDQDRNDQSRLQRQRLIFLRNLAIA
jgi:hypothetical protein